MSCSCQGAHLSGSQVFNLADFTACIWPRWTVRKMSRICGGGAITSIEALRVSKTEVEFFLRQPYVVHGTQLSQVPCLTSQVYFILINAIHVLSTAEDELCSEPSCKPGPKSPCCSSPLHPPITLSTPLEACLCPLHAHSNPTNRLRQIGREAPPARHPWIDSQCCPKSVQG